MGVIGDVSAWMAAHGVGAGQIIGTVAILAIALAIVLLFSRYLRSWLLRMRPRLGVPYETTVLFTRTLAGVVWVCALLLILNLWGISVAGLWAVLISVGTLIGVGFLATWAMVSNITASLLITVWRPFHLGETVEILPENLKGRVADRNLMFTVLREDSGAALHVPNNLFFQKIFRVSGGNGQYMLDLIEKRGEHAAARPAE